MPTNIETIEKTLDLSDKILTVGDLIDYLQQFDQSALVLMADESNPIHLEFHQIIEASQPSHLGTDDTYNTVYLVVE